MTSVLPPAHPHPTRVAMYSALLLLLLVFEQLNRSSLKPLLPSVQDNGLLHVGPMVKVRLISHSPLPHTSVTWSINLCWVLTFVNLQGWLKRFCFWYRLTLSNWVMSISGLWSATTSFLPQSLVDQRFRWGSFWSDWPSAVLIQIMFILIEMGLDPRLNWCSLFIAVTTVRWEQRRPRLEDRF